MESLVVKFVGTSPTIMHNGQLADPLNKYSKAIKEISAKRKKLDEDHEAMARIEFVGSLYLDQDGAPGWPGENIESMLCEAARKSKEGRIAKMSIFVDGVLPLIYKGPKTPEELWTDETFRISVRVRINGVTVTRTRPIFRKWELIVPILFDQTLVERSMVYRWCEVAGKQIGLGDWRPRYGRFLVEESR